jgi:hypothetical protein
VKKWLLALSFALLSSTAMAQLSPTATAQRPTSGPPGTQVVDAAGNVVGNLVHQETIVTTDLLPPPLPLPGTVLRQINGVWVRLLDGVTRDGLYTTAGPTLYYMSTDCTGTAYMSAETIPILGWLVANPLYNPRATTATIYYPALPFRSLQMASVVVGAGGCQVGGVSGDPIYVGLVATTTLTVVPPLSVR